MQKITTVNVTLLFLLLTLLDEGQLEECGRVITVNTAAGNDSEGCLEEGYPCYSLSYALYNLQSYDCVNITSNTVSLSREVAIHHACAIKITGQGNTTVMCSNNSGITFKNTSNVVIEGIIWDGCGDPKLTALGGITFGIYIANLSIRNCTFQFSKSRALIIWAVSGFIEMIDTQVIFNANYDPIYCHPDKYGIFRCNTKDFAVTGGVRIQESTGQTNVTIINCTFDHNGHFGEVINTENISYVPDGREVADGAGLLFNNINNFEVNILIQNTKFSSNRGRSGAGAYIKTINTSSINIVNTTFESNSVLNLHINSSAFMVFADHPRGLQFVPKLHMQFYNCNFYNNREGRNMINYIIAGAQSELVIENCTL